MNLSRYSVALGAAIMCSGGVATAPAAAQDAIALNRYRPSFAGDRFFAVGSPYAAGHLAVHAMLVMDYGHKPLVLRVDNAGGKSDVGNVVEHQLFMHANATFSLFERVAVNLQAPLALYQDGDSPTAGGTTFTSPRSGQFGDLRIGVRGRLFGDYDDPFQLGLTGYLWVPTGTDNFVGNSGAYGMPLLNVGGTVVQRFIYAVEVGPEIRPSASYANTSQGSAFAFGGAAGVLLGSERRVQLGVESHGSVTFSDGSQRNTNAELMVGTRWRFADDWVVGGGVGPGLSAGVGTPDVRSLLSIAYSPDQAGPRDRDNDSIADGADACPDVPGVANDDPRKHGCPAEKDRDGDGIVDPQDACPKTAGVASDDPTKHGCPLPDDDDRDGFINDIDACPQTAGIASSDPKLNGCPDSDGDSILDPADACPKQPGPIHADPKLNGCPDSDGDGIFDPTDACPTLAGPANPDRALHGCPPKDRDGDSILDGDDACPLEPGVKSADPKKNGCPKVRVTNDQIIVLERVEFATGRSEIRAESSDLLDQIAKVFLEHPEILRVEVQGHTDDRGGAALNRKLSDARAKAVVAALVNRGVARDRLSAKGYGPDRPIAGNGSADGRQKNRRVQFNILERKK